MSNELRSVHDVPPVSGKPIAMGDCVDCGKAWSMTPFEHNEWAKLVAEKDYHWPRRCKECRDKKRLQGRPPSLMDIYNRLKEMSTKAVNEDYELNSDGLAQDLTDLATGVESIMRQSPRREPRAS